MSCNTTDVASNGETFQNPKFIGDIGLDLAAIISLVRQLCGPLGTCIEDKFKEIITNQELTMAVGYLSVRHELNLSDSAKQHFINQICNELKACVHSHVNSNSFTDVTLVDANLNNVTFDEGTMNKIFAYLTSPLLIAGFVNELCPKMEACVAGHVSNHTFSNVTLSTPTINNMVGVGGSLTQANVINSTFLGGNTFREALLFDPPARASLCDAIESCVKAWIDASYQALYDFIERERVKNDAKNKEQDDILVDLLGRVLVLETCQPPDYVDCNGNSVQCQPLVTCDGLAQVLAQLETCTGTLQMPGCTDGTCLQPIVTCDELQQALDSQATCTGQVLGRPLALCEEVPDIVKEVVRTCNGLAMGDQYMASCTDVDDKIKAINTCTGTKGTAPLARCDEVPAIVQLTVRDCSGNPMGTQNMASCTDVDAKINAIQTCTGPKNARTLVACDEFTGLAVPVIRETVRDCSGNPMGVQNMASCADLDAVRAALQAQIDELRGLIDTAVPEGMICFLDTAVPPPGWATWGLAAGVTGSPGQVGGIVREINGDLEDVVISRQLYKYTPI